MSDAGSRRTRTEKLYEQVTSTAEHGVKRPDEERATAKWGEILERNAFAATASQDQAGDVFHDAGAYQQLWPRDAASNDSAGLSRFVEVGTLYFGRGCCASSPSNADR